MNKAAECDYVEANRRETAIRFVIDAFNGKADSLLAKVRHDNFGNLRQGLRDAYALVNHNGKAFRTRESQKPTWSCVLRSFSGRKEYERALKETAREEEAVA